MTQPLDLERFKALVAAYGGRPERFPERERAAAYALLGSSEEARAVARAESALDEMFALAPAPELSPALARQLAELPIRSARAERRSRVASLVTAFGWAAAAAFGVFWGARSEALERASSDDQAAEVTWTEGADELGEESEELVRLAVGALPHQLEEEEP